MAKEMKTRKELADLVLRETRASGKWADLHSVYVIGPVNRGYSNWDIGTSSDALSDFRKWQHVNNASDAFDHDGSPPTDEPLEVLCEDHVGTYVIPFLCQWSDGTWQNAKTRRHIEAMVIGWRVPNKNQR
jgi:hypothetical protein